MKKKLSLKQLSVDSFVVTLNAREKQELHGGEDYTMQKCDITDITCREKRS